MAQAKRTITTRKVTVAKQVPVVTLEMSEQEAQTLCALLRHVSGQPYINGVDGDLAPRGILTESILPVLSDALGAAYTFGGPREHGNIKYHGAVLPSSLRVVKAGPGYW